MTKLSEIPREATPVTASHHPAPRDSMPEHDAQNLTGPSGLAHIRLGDALYVLRITRQGKLILTK